MEVKIEGLKNQKGSMYIGAYDTKKDFEELGERVDGMIVKVAGSQISHVFKVML